MIIDTRSMHTFVVPGILEAEPLRCFPANIQHSSLDERAPVIDAYDDLFAITHVGYFQFSGPKPMVRWAAVILVGFAISPEAVLVVS